MTDVSEHYLTRKRRDFATNTCWRSCTSIQRSQAAPQELATRATR